MILIKCNKCKRIAVEISKEQAEYEDCLEAAKECLCGNSYLNFSNILKKDLKTLPQGVTLEGILRKDDV